MKKAIFVVGLVLLIVLSGCIQQQEEKVRIGAVLPLSGSAAFAGDYVKSGIDMAVDEINSEGGINGKRLEVVYEDDQCQPKLAVSATQKLINSDQVPIIVGSWCSSDVLAMAPVAEERKTVVMAIAISPKIRYAGDYIFRAVEDVSYHCKRIIPFVYDELGVRKMAILYINNDMGIGFKESCKKEFESLGGTIIEIEAFEPGASDFRTQLIKIKASNPAAIYISAYKEYGQIFRQVRELGLEQQLFGYSAVETKEVLDIAGNAAEGVVYTIPFDPFIDREEMQEYQKNYKERYGRMSEYFATAGYDSIKIIKEPLEKCGNDTECIKDELYKIKDFRGVAGNISFDEFGDAVKDIYIRQIKNGEFVPFEAD